MEAGRKNLRAVAERLAQDGWRVVVADRDPADPGIPARLVRADVSDEAAVAGLVDGVRMREGRLDGLVCNAGFMIRKPLRDLTLAELPGQCMGVLAGG